MITLEKVLQTQDLGQKGIDYILLEMLTDNYDEGMRSKDPLTAVIIDAFIGDASTKNDWHEMSDKLNYAIDMLTRAKRFVDQNMEG